MSNANRLDELLQRLASGPLSPVQLIDLLKISQPTLSRTIALAGDAIVRIGNGKSIQYAHRDAHRGLADSPVYSLSREGTLRMLGTLIAVRPKGYVMRSSDGQNRYSAGLPWWLQGMRPQGFLGRAFARQHAATLGLPANVREWRDADVLRALLTHGHDAVGNLIVGDAAREHFLSAQAASPDEQAPPSVRYPLLALAAEHGELAGSSAAGEQPKFTTRNPQGVAVLVKFTALDDNPVSQRWRDLLLAEHLASQTLSAAGISAAQTHLINASGRRFLEIERFDRVKLQGETGRCAVHSLAALDAEFIGDGSSPWPVITAQLAKAGLITRQAAHTSALLYAIGTLIGNTDMHQGNLSFIGDAAQAYELAPSYDMLPMAFAPSSSGALAATIPPLRLHPAVTSAVWHQALTCANDYATRLAHAALNHELSHAWQPCHDALMAHLADATRKIARLDV
jgi:hypothetical protein